MATDDCTVIVCVRACVRVCVLISIDRTFKMYYGGRQQRPDAPYARPIRSHDGKVIAHVGEGNRKDIRNAVEAAHRAAPRFVII